jgi:hypothetical protein
MSSRGALCFETQVLGLVDGARLEGPPRNRSDTTLGILNVREGRSGGRLRSLRSDNLFSRLRLFSLKNPIGLAFSLSVLRRISTHPGSIIGRAFSALFP